MIALPETLPTTLFGGLLVAFLAKHFIADFLLQTGWMASGKEKASNWLYPLCAHAAIHGLATALICLAFLPRLAWLGALDFVIHFVLDRAKALFGRSLEVTPQQAVYWWLLGLDQTFHHLTHLGFALAITLHMPMGTSA